MFDHVTIRASDREASERFYALVLATLGIELTYSGEDLVEWDDFSTAAAEPGEPVTRRLHIGFVAPTHELVDAFHRAGAEAGYRDDGAPGPPARPGRQQRRGCVPRRAPPGRQRRSPVGARRRRRCVGAVLRDRRV